MKPKVRFKGFSGEWKEVKLGDVFEKNEERNTDCSIGFDKTISVATMVYNPSGNGAADESLRTYKVLRVGDIAFEGNKSKNFAYGRFVMNDIGVGIMSPRFRCLRPKSPLVVDFWKKLINYEPLMRSRLVNSTKQGTMMNELVVHDVLKQLVPIPPSLPEQTTIANFFTHLDTLIASTSRRLEKLRAVKTAALQTLFPQEGEKEPRVRFKGFSGEWNRKSIGDVCSITAGGDMPKERFSVTKTDSFSIPIVSNGTEKNAIFGYTDSPKITQEAVTVAARGTIGYTEYRDYPYFPIVRLLSVLSKDTSTLNTKYLCYVLSIQRYNVTGAGIPQLTVPMISSVCIPIPSLPEQTAIANYYTHLDNLIQSTTRRLDKLRAVKAACLEGMFV